MEIKDKAGLGNMVTDQLCRLGPEVTPNEEISIDDSLSDGQLLTIFHKSTPGYIDLVNFKVCGVLPRGLSYQQKKKFLSDAKYYM